MIRISVFCYEIYVKIRQLYQNRIDVNYCSFYRDAIWHILVPIFNDVQQWNSHFQNDMLLYQKYKEKNYLKYKYNYDISGGVRFLVSIVSKEKKCPNAPIWINRSSIRGAVFFNLKWRLIFIKWIKWRIRAKVFWTKIRKFEIFLNLNKYKRLKKCQQEHHRDDFPSTFCFQKVTLSLPVRFWPMRFRPVRFHNGKINRSTRVWIAIFDDLIIFQAITTRTLLHLNEIRCARFFSFSAVIMSKSIVRVQVKSLNNLILKNVIWLV